MVPLNEPVLPYSPQPNGRAERPNRTILEKAKKILAELSMVCTMPDYRKLWPEALRCVVHVYNRTLTNNSHKYVRYKTPYEILTGEKPDLCHIRIFGTKVKVLKLKKYRDGKVNPRYAMVYTLVMRQSMRTGVKSLN